jgi:hypothetical protein
METGYVYYLHIYAVKMFKIWEIDEDWQNVNCNSNSVHLVYNSLCHFTDVDTVDERECFELTDFLCHSVL